MSRKRGFFSEEADGNLALIREIIRDTVWHEIAHHFGLDETEVREREDERGVR